IFRAGSVPRIPEQETGLAKPNMRRIDANAGYGTCSLERHDRTPTKPSRPPQHGNDRRPAGKPGHRQRRRSRGRAEAAGPRRGPAGGGLAPGAAPVGPSSGEAPRPPPTSRIASNTIGAAVND